MLCYYSKSRVCFFFTFSYYSANKKLKQVKQAKLKIEKDKQDSIIIF